MKTVLCTLSLLLIVTTNALSENKKFDAKEGLRPTELSCGEMDSVSVAMDDSPLYYNIVSVSMNNAKEFRLQGYFWNTAQYSFPTNGNIIIDVDKVNVIPLLLCIFTVFLVWFLLFYFSPRRSGLKAFAFSVFAFPLIFLLRCIPTGNSFHGDYIASLMMFLPYLVAWPVAYFIKKISGPLRKKKKVFICKRRGKMAFA